MNSANQKYLCHLVLIGICLLVHSDEANKKLQKIILASLIGKTLKSHMHQSPSIVPIMIPPFRPIDRPLDLPHNNGLVPNTQHYNAPTNHVIAQPPTITVHHYHHHTTSHNTIEHHHDGYDKYDGSYNHLIEPSIIHHHDYSLYDSHDNLGYSKQIGHTGNSLLSGSLGGNVGNILSGHIGGQVGR